MSSQAAIVAEIPRLRRYARALTGRTDAADDLVQDTLDRALAMWRFWQRDRELRPWLFSIMHNLHVDGQRRDGRIDFRADDDLPVQVRRATQDDALELRDMERALGFSIRRSILCSTSRFRRGCCRPPGRHVGWMRARLQPWRG